ncbi:hypothetical protein LzC2_32560 [Planctomycetes bacterium LzC2]|uniref:SRPBCC family protein n=2 Tax=Alienimonas chondri TaxID=2681879 RepID=A0ABX1VI75_9PLAN|nr:hypothetical protein [Alienimonas chondri]
MALISVDCRAAAPAAETFRVLTDLVNLPEAIPEILSITLLTDGPIGVGTRYTEERKMFGKSTEETFEVTAFEPPIDDGPGLFTVEADSCGMHMVAVHRVTPENDGSRIALEMTAEALPSAWMARIVSPIAGLLTGPSMRKMAKRDLERLAAAAEQV